MSSKSGQAVIRHPVTGTPCNPVLPVPWSEDQGLN